MALEALAVLCQCGFLASTLFTFHGRSCHNDKLSIQCPNDTAINIKWAQYGRLRSSGYQCHHFFSSDQPYYLEEQLDPKRFRRSRRKDLIVNEDCLASSSLEVVMSQCEGHQKCRVLASHRVFKETPCPFSQLEVGYQCIPAFYSKTVTCLGTEFVLQCPHSLRILIISATYGYKWPGEPKCQSKIGFDSECSAECSSYVVTNRCHGHRACRLFVDSQMFGDPCRPGTPPYLTVYHACVSPRILKKTIKKKDFPFSECSHQTTNSTSNGDLDYFKPHLLTTPLPTTTYKFFFGTQGRLFPHWVSVGVFIKKNIEKCLLYLVVGAFIGLVSLLLVVIAKLIFDAKFPKPKGMQNIMVQARPFHKRLFSGGSLMFPTGSRKGDSVRSRDSGREIELGRVSDIPGRSGPTTISVEELPSRLSAPDNGSPVFVHVESPRESPVLRRNNWNDEGNEEEEEAVDGRLAFPRATSLPRHSVLHETALLLPREHGGVLNGKTAVSESQLENSREASSPDEFAFAPVSFRSTSALPHFHETSSDLEDDSPPGASLQIVPSFSNPFRKDESLAKRKSSVRRRPANL